MERQHYVVFMVVAYYHQQAGPDGDRDYLLPVKAPDGQMTYFTLEQANAWIEHKVNDTSSPHEDGLMGREYYDTGVPVYVGDMRIDEVSDMAQRLWGVRPADLARLAEHWPEE